MKLPPNKAVNFWPSSLLARMSYPQHLKKAFDLFLVLFFAGLWFGSKQQTFTFFSLGKNQSSYDVIKANLAFIWQSKMLFWIEYRSPIHIYSEDDIWLEIDIIYIYLWMNDKFSSGTINPKQTNQKNHLPSGLKWILQWPFTVIQTSLNDSSFMVFCILIHLLVGGDVLHWF